MWLELKNFLLLKFYLKTFFTEHQWLLPYQALLIEVKVKFSPTPFKGVQLQHQVMKSIFDSIAVRKHTTKF